MAVENPAGPAAFRQHLVPVHCRAPAGGASSEIQSPELVAWSLQLQPQFPAGAPLVPPPHDNRLALVVVEQVYRLEVLSNRETLRYDGQAALRRNVHSIAFGPQNPARLAPFERNFYP